MLITVLQQINEKTTEGSKSPKKGRTVKAKKSRVKVYDTIDAALKSGAPYGTIFSTKAADRLYVISKPTWGAKSMAGGNTRIAKGFTPGSATPSASWPSIKSHAVRTMLKHGKSKSGRLTQKYGPGKERPEEKRYAGKKLAKKKKIKEAKCPASSKLAQLLPLLNLIKRVLVKETIQLEAKKVNPWAICHAQLGKEKTAKFERCVKKVKAKHGIKEMMKRYLDKRDLAEASQGPSLRKKIKHLAEIARRAGPGAYTDVRRSPGSSVRGAPTRRKSSGVTHGTPLEAHMLKVLHPDTGVKITR